ncbi:MAG: DUF3793 family protein [Bacillota bacterium]|nr:DUF3793 family protein [Bacillota bacterium]
MDIDRELAEVFVKKLQSLDDKGYFKSIINYNLAPLIYSTKPACLLSFTKYNRDLYSLWNKYLYVVNKRNIISFEIKRTKEAITVLFYNPARIKRIVKDRRNVKFLETLGYNSKADLLGYLHTLKKRFKGICPHEVAIFLGIPIDDVIGFIKNQGKGYSMCGYWKVYSNLKSAEDTFTNYDKARIKVLNKIVQDSEG